MPLASRSAAIIILTATVAGCSPQPSLPPQAPPFVLVTAAADATSTATPFQPCGGPAPSAPSGAVVIAHFSQPVFVAFPYLDSPISFAVPTACGAPAGWVIYTVQAGDTLHALSQYYGISQAALELANCLTGPFLISGQRLYVPFVVHPTGTTTRAASATPSPTATSTSTNTTGVQPSRTNTPRSWTLTASSTATATRTSGTATRTMSPTPTNTSPPATHTATVDPHHTGEASPSVTSSPTRTLTPTSTLTATAVPPTATATSPLNQPGLYTFTDRCVLLGIPETTITVDYCLVSVFVASDGSMRFDLAWTPHLEGSGYDYVEIYSDAGNTGLYLTDDTGINYAPYGLLGLAAFGGYLGHNETDYSGYLFPPPDPGSRSFRFTNDAVGAAFANIVLTR